MQMRGALKELFGEVHEAVQTWWLQFRTRRATAVVHDLTPDNDEIVFHPTDPDKGSDTASLDAGNSVCPVTRQSLDAKAGTYQCERCGIRYSPEGWQFLRQTDRGACCICRCIGTVRPVVKVR